MKLKKRRKSLLKLPNSLLKPLQQFLFLCCFQGLSSLSIAMSEPILLWHSLAGSLGEELSQLVAGFNNSQNDFYVKAIYKGEYTEALTSFAASFRAHQPPDIIQVYEVGTATMLTPPGIIKPLYALLEETGITLDEVTQSLPAIRAFYSRGGRIMAMPFNTSVPLIFYNASLLASFGIKDRSQFPKTWDDLQGLAERMKKSGLPCVYTTAYPAWIHIESFAAIHGLSLFDHTLSQAKYNNSSIIHHLNRLKDWQKKHYFEYGGRGNEATVLFTSGRCALFSQSSGAYKGLAALVPFHLGVAPQPLDQSISKLRHNNVIGGGALWTVAKDSNQHYKGIALFYKYLAQASVQARWYQNTGYLPFSIQGSIGVREPTLDIAQFDLGNESDFLFAELIPLIPQNQIRSINDEALEAIFSNTKEPIFAMNEAVARANFAIKRFSMNTESRNWKH